MDIIFLLAILILLFLLASTFILTSKLKSFKKILIVHSITFIVFTLFVIFYSKLLTGHDEYGIRQMGLGLAFMVIHIIIGFIHGIYLNHKH